MGGGGRGEGLGRGEGEWKGLKETSDVVSHVLAGVVHLRPRPLLLEREE